MAKKIDPNDPYEGRTLEQCKREGYPDTRSEDLRWADRRKRDEAAMHSAGLWGESLVG